MGTFLSLNMFAIQYQNTIEQVKRRGAVIMNISKAFYEVES